MPRLTVGFIANREDFLANWTNDLDLTQVAATLEDVARLIRQGDKSGLIRNYRGKLVGSWLLKED